ncbi:unnamed protein product [Cuscuta epithymum]|uniref:Uncharacterized protein n=1 Tax=Cuscuta epithymum TaxID=186058 RepID=A0AAV0FSN5_9ASTE|nr:unnamed protein product [Cuscuta epithymum]
MSCTPNSGWRVSRTVFMAEIGRSWANLGIKAGTDLDSRSSEFDDESRSLAENMMNYRQDEKEATILLACPPPELPPRSAGEPMVWKKTNDFDLIPFYFVCVFVSNCMFWLSFYSLAEKL